MTNDEATVDRAWVGRQNDCENGFEVGAAAPAGVGVRAEEGGEAQLGGGVAVRAEGGDCDGAFLPGEDVGGEAG